MLVLNPESGLELNLLSLYMQNVGYDSTISARKNLTVCFREITLNWTIAVNTVVISAFFIANTFKFHKYMLGLLRKPYLQFERLPLYSLDKGKLKQIDRDGFAISDWGHNRSRTVPVTENSQIAHSYLDCGLGLGLHVAYAISMTSHSHVRGKIQKTFLRFMHRHLKCISSHDVSPTCPKPCSKNEDTA